MLDFQEICLSPCEKEPMSTPVFVGSCPLHRNGIAICHCPIHPLKFPCFFGTEKKKRRGNSSLHLFLRKISTEILELDLTRNLTP